MGLLDDAIREHLELKRRHGAPEAEVDRLADEVFGSNAPAPAEAPDPARTRTELVEEPDLEPDVESDLDPGLEPLPPEPEPVADIEVPEDPEPAPAADPEPPAPAAERRSFTDEEPWLDDPDEVPAEETLEHRTIEPGSEYVEPDEGPEGEDVLEETPDFLQETPEHDRLWFEQKPPRDFDLGN